MYALILFTCNHMPPSLDICTVVFMFLMFDICLKTNLLRLGLRRKQRRFRGTQYLVWHPLVVWVFSAVVCKNSTLHVFFSLFMYVQTVKCQI